MNFVKQLLTKLGIGIVSEDRTIQSNQSAAMDALQKIADRGVVARMIPDPLAWQKEIR